MTCFDYDVIVSILNNLTGRSRHSPRHCPVSADAIASLWLEMGNTRLLTASHLDLSFKKCLTFGGPQHHRDLLHAGAALKTWLRDILSSCLRRLKISKIWRRALVVAIPKPAKPVGDPKSYRSIFLLCVPYKILERLIYARVEPLIDPLLPKEQAGFRRGKSTVDQVVILTQNIEDSFEAKKKAGAIFINLTAACDIV